MYNNRKKLHNKKIMVIGSGPIVVGQAAEFDYAGTQACTTLKEFGYEIVLINPNPATIMTDKTIADKIYMEPLNLEAMKKIIRIEKPAGLLSSVGGQSGLNLAMELEKIGFLKENHVELLGARYETIQKAEDRLLFKKTMLEIGQPVIASIVSDNKKIIADFATEIGFPVIIRPAFTLGGSGGGTARSYQELENMISVGKKYSPIKQVIIEKNIYGFKEIEFEIVRDASGTSLCVCCMENLDPVGVHTGDSIVIAPAVSLDKQTVDMLKKASFDIVTALKVEGACNCQFAVCPSSSQYFVIEVNPRVSRSSALASKATGYPIAKVATKIAVGCLLQEIKNDLIPALCAKDEPQINYFVIKIPKWANNKLKGGVCKIGIQMKATGESMAIGETFEEALLKAFRSTYGFLNWMFLRYFENLSITKLFEQLKNNTSNNFFVIFELIKRNVPLRKIYDICKVDYWFLHRLQDLNRFNIQLKTSLLSTEIYKKAKMNGYSDNMIEQISGQKIPFKLQMPNYKIVDIGKGKFPLEQKYFFSTYNRFQKQPIIDNKSIQYNRKKIVILGSGPITIGQGIEFDYACVHAVLTYKKLGYEVIMVNNNPETVSTDYNIADKLYFEPLTIEDIIPIINIEKPLGVVVAFGGQTSLNLVNDLGKNKIKIIGSSPKTINITENRETFNRFLDKLNIKRPFGFAETPNKIIEKANYLKYPVVLRPSYVIGGNNIVVANKESDIMYYFYKRSAQEKKSYKIFVDQYLNGIEVEVDAVCDGYNVLIPGIIQHIERAGIHSGDSICVFPHYDLPDEIVHKIIEVTKKIAQTLKVRGPMNIQFVITKNEVYVIEVNLRSSRSVPIVSKTLDISLVELAVKAMNGYTFNGKELDNKYFGRKKRYGVKIPIFSFEKIEEVEIEFDTEMKSTGEVLAIDSNFKKALYKGLITAGYKLKKRGNVLIDVTCIDAFLIEEILNIWKQLSFNVYLFDGSNFYYIQNIITNNPIAYIISIKTTDYKDKQNSFYFRRFAVTNKIDLIYSFELLKLIAHLLKANFSYNTLAIRPIND